jgi:hypothetical protein
VTPELRDGEFELRTAEARYPFRGDAAQVVGRVVGAMDGVRRADELSRAAGYELEEVLSLAEQLFREGLVGDRSQAAVPAEIFYDHARHSGVLWRSLANHHRRLLDAIFDGKATPKLVLGALIEEWHYVRRNPDHASSAVLNARNRRTQQLWAEFAADEYPHGSWMEEGLASVLTRDELRRCHPLPGTVALCAQVARAAQTSELGYAACMALCEHAPGELASDTQVRYYRAMMTTKPWPESVFEPYLRHAETDAQAGHLDFTRVPYLEHPPLDGEERAGVLGHVWDHVGAYDLYYRNIWDFYAEPDGPALHLVPDC